MTLQECAFYKGGKQGLTGDKHGYEKVRVFGVGQVTSHLLTALPLTYYLLQHACPC